MPIVDIAALDSPKPLPRDASLFAANCAALREVQPEIAAWLDADSANNWDTVVAHDGSVAAVRRGTNGIEWLDQTQLPATRARAALRDIGPGDRNYALATTGSGAEIELLLARFASHQTLYVLVDAVERLRAVLSLRDHAADIRRRRLIFVDASRVEEQLLALLGENEGLLVPAAILATPPTGREHIAATTSALQRVAARTGEERAAAMNHLAGGAVAVGGAVRVAVLALRPVDVEHALAHGVADEAARVQIDARVAAFDSPLQAHALVHERAIASLAPTVMLSINHPPTLHPARTAKVLRWQTTLPGPNEVIDAATLILAGTPTVEQHLLRCGVPRDRIRPAYIGPPTSHLTRDLPPFDQNLAAILGDWIEDDAARAGIRQPTHRQLWQRARELLEGGVKENDLNGDALLHLAERDQRVVIDEASIRAQFVAAVDAMLIPAWASRCTARALRESGMRVIAIGSGWGAAASVDEIEQARSLDSIATSQHRPRIAVVTSCADLLTPAATWAAGAGWPLLFVGVARRIRGAVEPVLRESDLLTTPLPAELPALIARDVVYERRAESARAHLRRRSDLSALVAILGGA